MIQRGSSRDVEALILAPVSGCGCTARPASSQPGPALLWIHGGGYVIGTAAQDDAAVPQVRPRTRASPSRAVDYRLAPEHPYPAPLEDCYAALTWLAALPGVDPARIAIGGASAGGGLAAALALLARDRGEVDAGRAAAGLSDARRPQRARRRTIPSYRLWRPKSNRFGWTAYLGDADPQVAVPARRTDLAGLPPAWIGVGTLDLFHDEDLAYAERLHAAGVPCQVEVVPGAFHGFDAIVPQGAVSTVVLRQRVRRACAIRAGDYKSDAYRRTIS